LLPSYGDKIFLVLPTSSYGGATGYVNIPLTAFKNKALFKQLEVTRHHNEIALLPSGSKSMWYVDSTLPQWGLYPNSL
jgi:hypothetical protein